MKDLRKLLFLLLICNILNVKAHAQENETWISNVDFGFSSDLVLDFNIQVKDGLLFTTQIDAWINQHCIKFGPVWWIDNNNSNSNPFRGLNASYQFFPTLQDKSLNFYFIYDLLYTYEKDSWETTMYFFPDRPKNQLYLAEINTLWRSFKNQIGYGFEWEIYNGLYLNQCFGIGMEWFLYKHKTTVKADSDLTSEYSDSSWDNTSFLKIGIGYQF